MRYLLTSVLLLFTLLRLPVVAQPTAGTSTPGTVGTFIVSFTGEPAPDWEYFVEEKSGENWVEVPGAVSLTVTPIRFQRPVTVGATYSIRMRGRSTLDRALVSAPSPESTIMIPKPNTAPGNVELKVLIVITVVNQ